MTVLLQVLAATGIVAALAWLSMYAGRLVARQRMNCKRDYDKTGCGGGCGGRRGAGEHDPAATN